MWQLNSTVYCSEFIVQFIYFSCVWNLVVLWLFRVLEHSLHLLYICQSQYKMQITVTASSSSCMAAICQYMLCCPFLKSLDPSTLHCWSCLHCLVISSQLKATRHVWLGGICTGTLFWKVHFTDHSTHRVLFLASISSLCWVRDLHCSNGIACSCQQTCDVETTICACIVVLIEFVTQFWCAVTAWEGG